MDRIEAWVAEDLQAVTAGVKELELANKHKRARRKKMVMLVCCLMVGLFFVVWPVLGWLPDSSDEYLEVPAHHVCVSPCAAGVCRCGYEGQG